MIKILPLKELDAEITVPPSKYIANRVIPLAALSKGTSIIKNIPDNDDINNSIKALKQLGIKIKKEDNSLIIKGSEGTLQSAEEKKYDDEIKEKKTIEINVGHSGTLLRFITGISALREGKTIITGSKRIQERPIKDLLDALSQLGIKSQSLNNENKNNPPIIIHGGTLKGGKTKIKGNISSQYISSLLLISPFAKKDTEIIIESELVSKNYVDLTIKLMREFGVEVKKEGYKKFKIKATQNYIARKISIPGDWSSASYFLGAAAIIHGKIKIKNMDLNSIQGESKFYKVLEKMGCKVKKGEDCIELRGTKNLKSINIDMSSMPDTAQTLSAVALFAKGKTKIKNIENLKIKESDRIEDTAKELRKTGAKVKTGNDFIEIIGLEKKENHQEKEIQQLNLPVIETHDDHRTAMSLALVGLKKGIIIKNPETAGKSYPGFWKDLKKIGAKIIDE